MGALAVGADENKSTSLPPIQLQNAANFRSGL
jgi:hypothetical protein